MTSTRRLQEKTVHHRLVPTIATLAAVLLAGTACGSDDSPSKGASSAGDAKRAAAPAPADPAAVGADETGAVPVLMYHQVIPSPKGVYDRTPEDFRAELERLAREGYVPITAADYATGHIDIPAGAHPVVLTFDDSSKSQFGIGPDGNAAPNTAVGILLDVARTHPAFRPVATMFVNADPFGDPGGRKTLPWLRDHGFEVGNHTRDHANLRSAGPDVAARQIAEQQAMILAALPGATVATLALPFGAEPRPATLAAKGTSGTVTYEHRGVFLVGSNPAPSPFAPTFDPGAVPRIRSAPATGEDAQFGSTTWLDKLADGRVRRYTSDGDPTMIAYPRSGTAPAAAYTSRSRAY
ncbi:polysaccharide deacetylase family protein [Embleya scabrispora]|uniref:polysaccharide deacetylase family protein n=1 Tax=Embleya scabrispora TaxID=159449 RepID=UPI000365E699|nr:polysaccharide deacetylase family protein [Embleya scabrispora]